MKNTGSSFRQLVSSCYDHEFICRFAAYCSRVFSALRLCWSAISTGVEMLVCCPRFSNRFFNVPFDQKFFLKRWSQRNFPFQQTCLQGIELHCRRTKKKAQRVSPARLGGVELFLHACIMGSPCWVYHFTSLKHQTACWYLWSFPFFLTNVHEIVLISLIRNEEILQPR